MTFAELPDPLFDYLSHVVLESPLSDIVPQSVNMLRITFSVYWGDWDEGGGGEGG